MENKKKIKVLLIEDNPGDVRLIEEMLKCVETPAVEIEIAGRLSEGLEMVGRKRYDILLLDPGLPDSQGLETIRRVQAHKSDLPFVVLTGLDDEQFGIMAVQEGAQDYLVKGQVNDNLLARTLNYSIERKRGERALRESEERYRHIVETTVEGVWAIDQDNRTTFVNERMAEMLGYATEEMIGRSLLDFLDRNNASDIRLKLERKRDIIKGHYELRLRHRNGNDLWTMLSVNPQFDNDDSYIGLLAMVSDISEHHRNEVRQKARYFLLNGLRTAQSIDQCLSLGCQAIYEAELFRQSLFTLHNSQYEVIAIGYFGLKDDFVDGIKKASAPRRELAEEISKSGFRLGNSYYIPHDTRLDLAHTSAYLPLKHLDESKGPLWKSGDLLLIPVGPAQDAGGWLVVNMPLVNEKPSADEISFLEDIVDTVMARVREIRLSGELEEERQALEGKNIALREILASIEAEKMEIRKQVATVVQDVLLPAVKRLVRKNSTINMTYYHLLKTNLQELASGAGGMPIASKLSPRELEICSLIKEGASSKDIADALSIALVTVQKHREIIRKKLGLTNKRINLVSHLRTI